MDYWTEANENPIERWYEVQDPAVQAAFDVTLFTLGATEDWEAAGVQEFKVLTERHAGLGEIRFYVDAREPGLRKPRRRRFRPVGIWRPEEREFILLLGCEKSGRIYIPPNAFDLALQYRKDFEQGRGTIREHL